MPPIYKIDLRRNIGSREDARNIYYLTDGTVSEMEFFDALFNSTNCISSKSVRFIKCEKTGDDEGVSNGLGLIKMAHKYIENISSFKHNYDKILIVFDLDVYCESLDLIVDAIKNEKDIIFAFSNPSFELFLLLCLDNNFIANTSKEELEAILQNSYVGKDRYVYHYIKIKFDFDSKDRKSNFLKLANNLDLKQDYKVNIYLNKAATELTCNIPYVLRKIQENDFANIVYLLP